MESKSNMVFTESGVLEDQIILCKEASVLASAKDVNSSVPNVQGLKNVSPENTQIVSVTEFIPETKYLNELPLDNKDLTQKVLESGMEKVAHEEPIKAASPTIFENAVNAVKNLFSPAKAHGLFSRGIYQQDNRQPESKKILNGEIKYVNGNTSSKIEHLPVTELEVPPYFSNFESNLCLNEEDAPGLVAKRISNSADAHNNTNDSYTTTVSLMDESFQSTVTHFEYCMQNEVGNSKNSVASIENISVFDNSMNDTVNANEQSLNNTLKKNSSSVIDYGELNATFEGDEIKEFFISDIENKEIYGADARGVHEIDTQNLLNMEENEVFKNNEVSLETGKEALELLLDIITSHVSEKNKSFEEENLINIASNSTPKKQQSLEDTNRNNSPFYNNFSENLNHLQQKTVESIVEVSDALQDAVIQNEESLSQFSTISRPSEIVCSDSSTSENFLSEKSNSPVLSTSLEKNFSTSTIIISKNDFDNINTSEEKDNCVRKHQLSLTDNESLINSEVKTGEIQNFAITRQEHSDGACLDNEEEINICSNKSPLILKNVQHTDTDENSSNLAHFDVNEFLKNCPPESKSYSKLDIQKPHTSEKAAIEIFYQNLEELNLLENNLSSENEIALKSEECPVNEIEIPLASQKSYTVLHNHNPNLNLPVVSDNICDVEADKLNDIILGDRAFSDLNVLCNKNIDSDEISISHHEIDASTSDCVEVNTDGIISADTTRNITSDNTDLKTCDLEARKGLIIDTEDKLEFAKSLLLSCSKSYTTAGLEPENEISSCLKQKERSSSVDLTNGTSEISNNDTENMPKSESSIVRPENSIIISRNFTEADVLFLAGKKEDKTNKKSHSELELSPLLKHISSDEAAKESFGNNVVSCYTCGDGDSLSSGNFDVPVEKNDFTGNSLVKDFCRSEEVLKELNLNTGSEIMENMESTVKDSVENDFEVPTLQIDLENVISDLARLKMNDSATETPKKCYSESCNPFCINSKLNDTVNLHDGGGLCEKNNSEALSSINELTQLIKEQFSVNDIEKICSVVDEIPELNLSKNIALASQQFDKSFHGKILNESENNVLKENNFVIKDENDLDFLDSIKGKPSKRDYSRESLYIKFDPLVQSKHSSTLLDISEGDKENVISSPVTKHNSTSDSLIPITPLKQNININSMSPLTPTSQNNESKLSTEKLNKLRELQNEISRLREHYLQKEEIHKEKMNNYENVIAELTGKASVLEDKLKESEEMEKLLLKKLNTQNESMGRLRNTIEECMTYISKLIDELQKTKKDNQKQVSVLQEERDYYMNHLQMTEQAFSDVFNKYEKCKEAVKTYKMNEERYELTIENMNERIEQYSEKIKSMQESATKEVSKLQEKINDLKLSQTQEISKFKAQLRITELKVQTMQEALDQKIKENQELAGICDELIESKECDR